MAGLIVEEDLETVRERARIEDIVGAYVALRPAGGGALTGLCPFHDEKTPSFRVTPSKGFYYCFGCSEGGDVIKFVQRINNMSFTEAVEFLADKVGVQLRYTEGERGSRQEPGLRMRILEANAAAADFFARELLSPDALIGRQFLDGRGFTREHAEHFGLGFAPIGGHALRDYLLSKKFTKEELVKAGLVRENGWDFFQGRLLWPIRDAGRSVLGFGARRLRDDDRMPAKYLNTPETVVYKKSHVLYGLDLARKAIGKKNQAVVVEGYTDVMACHIAGVDTAVASCGTAFGEDHSRMVDRLMTGDAQTGEVIFTFDGDAAGQAAALKAFQMDHTFSAQTYVAVEPEGLDPCDVRIKHGDAAVRELVARRQPLYRFVMRNVVGKFDLDRADGRLAAVRAAAPLVSSVRDAGLVSGYVHELAGMVGMNPDEVRREIARAPKQAPDEGRRPETKFTWASEEEPEAPRGPELPDPHDRRFEIERATLRLLLQHPLIFDAEFNGISADDFSHAAYRAVFTAQSELDPAMAGRAQAVSDAVEASGLSGLVAALAVEDVLGHPDAAYAREHSARLKIAAVTRQINTIKSRLQRTNPVDDQADYNRLFATLLEFEARRRDLQAEALADH